MPGDPGQLAPYLHLYKTMRPLSGQPLRGVREIAKTSELHEQELIATLPWLRSEPIGQK